MKAARRAREAAAALEEERAAAASRLDAAVSAAVQRTTERAAVVRLQEIEAIRAEECRLKKELTAAAEEKMSRMRSERDEALAKLRQSAAAEAAATAKLRDAALSAADAEAAATNAEELGTERVRKLRQQLGSVVRQAASNQMGSEVVGRIGQESSQFNEASHSPAHGPEVQRQAALEAILEAQEIVQAATTATADEQARRETAERAAVSARDALALLERAVGVRDEEVVRTLQSIANIAIDASATTLRRAAALKPSITSAAPARSEEVLRDLRRAGRALRDLAASVARAASATIESSRQLSVPARRVHEAVDAILE